jgi:hypothetical protein
VDADLDTLATALYVRTDDLLKDFPEQAPWRPAIGITPALSDAEQLTLAVMQALLGFVSESRWLRYARKSLRGLFPRLPGQPGYNKRLRKLGLRIRHWAQGIRSRAARMMLSVSMPLYRYRSSIDPDWPNWATPRAACGTRLMVARKASV